MKQSYNHKCTCNHDELDPKLHTLLVITVNFNFVVITSFIELSSFSHMTAVVYMEIYILSYAICLL